MDNILDILEALEVPVDDCIDNDTIDYMEQDDQLSNIDNINQWYLEV